ncbi:MAG: class I SAM-dependent DNA methyltransferase [bacterium]|nr:class I SAM-dependent DNA methyltransferase [bacterium]
MATHNQISSTIWNVANHLRGSWKAYEYQDVILPLTVLKRLDAALEPTKQKALERFNELDGKVSDLRIIRRVTGYDFYNISPFTFKKLLDDPIRVARNLRKYIDGFSDNVKEIFAKFDFEKQLERLEGSNILYLILQEFDKIDLHPDQVPNHVIGLAFEDLIRRFAEQSNETAGEHYTPRDVVRLMTGLIFTGEEKELAKHGVVKTLYDPACGTGGMLTVGKDYIQNNFNKDATVYLFGQELNSATYAICKADMLLKGENIEHIKGGDKEHDKASTLSNDQHHDKKFDYIISNPPYGVEWKKDKDAVDNEARRGFTGRFGAGLPRISDGQLLFLQHAVSKFKSLPEGGSDAAIIFNGSPLFTGDAGGGESEIRRWLLENDYLDAIVALPEQLFFNTGISTYVWLLSNRKPAERKGKVMLIDARTTRTQLRRNLGAKRYEMSEANAKEILDLYDNYKENERAKVFPTTAFAYREITIQRPLRLTFVLNDEKIKELLMALGLDTPRAVERVKEAIKQEKEQTDSVMGPLAEKRRYKADEQWEIQMDIKTAIHSLRNKTWKNREKFIDDVDTALSLQNGVRQAKKVLKTIIDTVGVRDENADICLGKDGKPEPDNELKDFERVPWGVDIREYFKKEVKPYAPDAWIDESVRDAKDGKAGIVGYEIPFTRYFYKYQEPRGVEEIEVDIKAIEADILELMKKI